ncbi:TonB-dependent receptor [Chitinophaga agrisoli]|uniref:TonB-dependent receptor n=1 Tax=Chitinophaga agrisoli TaxID=2607653 RepID=UPI001FEBFD3C|nr:TonB-dependent receptor [Chitinophaga agrisoli]
MEQQTSYTFIYDPEYLKQCNLTGLKLKDNTLAEVLHYLDVYAPIDISYNNNTVALRKGKQERVADKGRITGKVVDNKNEPLPGVTIQIEGGQGTVTNVDGTYDLQLEPGTYTLTFSYISYESRKVTEIVVTEKGITPLNVSMKSAGSRLKEVTVTANYKKASVEGLYAIQKNNAAISDGISADVIARTPDKNVGEVLKRVSGLSTMDNKYVVVRGLSERYNQAMLNGQIMPSTELNRKNFNFDIIPANMVENITVIKTLTPDQSAEFGGGLVQVNTAEIPTHDFLNISAGGSINDNTTGKTFNSLKLEGREYWGKAAEHRDFLGTQDWKTKSDMVNQFQKQGSGSAALANNWGLYEMKALPSQNYKLSGGKVFKLANGNRLGILAAVSYRNTLATQDVEMTRNAFGSGRGVNPYADSTRFKGKRYGFTTNLGGLAGIGYQTEKHRISFQTLYLRSLDQQLILGKGQSEEPDAFMLGYYDLTTQTEVWQNQLKGEHVIGKHKFKLSWMGSYLNLDRMRPDNHAMKATVKQVLDDKSGEYNLTTPIINDGAPGGALRTWSRAYEKNYNWQTDLSMPFKKDLSSVHTENTAKIGYAGWAKDRSFFVLNTGSVPTNTETFPPLSQIFDPAGTNVFLSPFNDDFHKTATLHAVYGMLDNRIGEKWRLVWGVRAEYYNLNNVNTVLDSLFKQINSGRPDAQYDYSALKNREPNWNLFPSANLTYSLTQQMNLRLAYAKSIIRPDLRELAFFREYDFELGGEYQSGLVRSTVIDHLDFRYEWYPGPGEIMSLSLFYKDNKYPMEIYKQGDNRVYVLRNNKSAKNYGVEVEIRKSLQFTKVPVIKNITLYGNFTYLDAKVVPMTLEANRFAEDNPLKIAPEEVLLPEEKRPQTGASNYMVNAGVYYDTKPVSLSVVYNYVTNRVFRPSDIYAASLFERPLEALDAQLAFRFLKQKAEVRANVANILNSSTIVYTNNGPDGRPIQGRAPTKKELLYQKETDLVDYMARPGRTYSMTLSYTF